MATPQGYPDRSGINRYGEENIRPDYYEDEYGMRHPYVDDLEHPVEWSSDPRSEASREKHRGKGPRNFSRTDEHLREEVCEALLMNPDLDPQDIDVTVQNGVVTLKGRVRVSHDRFLAEDLAHDVSGVKEVINHIDK